LDQFQVNPPVAEQWRRGILIYRGEYHMALRTLSAQMPEREILLAAIKLKMLDFSIAQISKAILLCELEGYTPRQAKQAVVEASRLAEDKEDMGIISVGVPVEWVEKAKRDYPDLSLSQFFRYCTHKLTESPETARERAIYRRGWEPGRPRNQRATA
jgi:hypothetical protein